MEQIREIPLYITKSSLHDGTMSWSAVNSDTDWDLYGERMSLELYKSMLGKIAREEPPPEPWAELVTSDYWKGGMPYLSIAHYSDGNGKAVPGDVLKLYIDGNQLKAKGTLHNSPLGKAVWKSLKQDEIEYKSDPDAERIRISIAFLDLAHKHGEDGEVFRRNSLSDNCPLCKRGVGEKIYVDGYLVHLALTRKPVNPRTIMEAEDVMAKKSKIVTRRDDAASVLGDETLAEVVAETALESKSDVLVEMSETEPPVEEVPVTEPTIVTEVVEAKSMDDVEAVQIWKPFGGATSMKEAQKYTEAQQESWRVSDLYYTFTDVARNIMDSETVSDKAAGLASLVDEFKKMLVAKSLYEEMSQIREGKLEEIYMTAKKSELEEVVSTMISKALAKDQNADETNPDAPDMSGEEKKKKSAEMKSDTVSIPVEKSALELSVDNLYNVVNGAIGKSITADAKLQEIQPALDLLGTEILNAVQKSTVNSPAAQPDNSSMLLEEIRNLSNQLGQMATEVATLKAQTVAPSVQTQKRVPVPRSVTVERSATTQAPEIQPGSVKDIARRSVGL